MTRLLQAALAVIALAAPAVAAPPVGNWKFRASLPSQRGPVEITFLIAFTDTDGKWAADIVGTNPELRVEPKVTGVAVNGEAVKFAIEFSKGDVAYEFEGIASKDGKKLTGSYSLLGGPLRVTELVPTKLRKLSDPFELAREEFAQTDGGQPLFDAGYVVLARAAEKKLTADEVRGIAEKLTKAAAGYGPRWERATALKLAETLAGQEGLGEVAVTQARRAERMLTDDTPIAVQMLVLDTVAKVLTKSGKAADAKKYEADLAKLEAQDQAAYAKETLSFETPAFAGRKAKSGRVAVVEVFTGAEHAPSAPADAAYDGLLKTFKPADVLFLSYHIHFPAADPLANEDSMARAMAATKDDKEDQDPAPKLFVNGKDPLKGKEPPKGGAPGGAAKWRYAGGRAAIEKDLEEAARAKLSLSVAKGEKGLTVKAAVSELDKPGEKVRLRFAVVEPVVRYIAGNGERFHQNVVRAMPGGAGGFPLPKKDQEQTVPVNVDDLRAGLNKHLDDVAKRARAEFSDRPLKLKNLKVIAFIQDDATGDILTAAQVDLDAK